MNEARPIGEILAPLIQRSKRIAIFGQLLETYDTDEERMRLVLGLYARDCLSRQAAEILLEAYGLERAL